MNAKQYLQQIRKINAEVEMLESEIENLYKPIKAVSYGGVPGTPDYDATLHLVERITELQKRYSDKLKELIEKRNEIIGVIERMPLGASKRVIYYRYVQMMGFRAIAKKMLYSQERIMQLHREGLKDVEWILTTMKMCGGLKDYT